nr:hypothetical protein B0A51_12074 [Rachicladosporium sp. CCFEE 5018]
MSVSAPTRLFEAIHGRSEEFPAGQANRGSMFGSLKSKLSTKRSGKEAAANASDHPQRQSMPATRRPAAGTTNAFRDPDTRDAPPAYSAAPSAITTTAPILSSTTSQAPEADSAYTFLSTFDTIFLIDDSGSMAGSRWAETSRALQTITPICTQHDKDGIDIYFLNHPDSSFAHNVTSASTVHEVFSTVRPGGGTPTGQKLNGILKPYIRRFEAAPETTKPINIICITDGEPSDDVESPLISAAKKLDKLDAPAWQVGVQFFQVGRDAEASKHLKMLDDELAEIAGEGELRDMVDTVPFRGAEGATLTGDGILKVVLGAVTRRLDRKSKELHRSTNNGYF